LCTVASVLSLLLCAATAALWVRSYWWQYSLFHVGHAHQGRSDDPQISIADGVLWMRNVATFVQPGREPDFDREIAGPYMWHAGWHFDHMPLRNPAFSVNTLWTFGFRRNDQSGFGSVILGERDRQVYFPLWLPALVFAVWPAVRGGHGSGEHGGGEDLRIHADAAATT